MTYYKQLCAELVETWDATADFDYKDFGNAVADLVDRIRAALAEPESEGPTDADLHAMAFSYSQPCYEFEYIPFAAPSSLAGASSPIILSPHD